MRPMVYPHSEWESNWSNVKEWLWNTFEQPHTAGLPGKIVMVVMLATIVFSTLMLTLESMPELDNATFKLWVYSELSCTILFSLEYTLRYVSCPEKRYIKLQFIFRLLNVIDLIAIVPFYVGLIQNGGLPQSEAQYSGSNTSGIWRVFRVIRLVRALRVVKMGRYSTSLSVFGGTMRKAGGAIVVMILLLMLADVFFAAIVFELEHDDNPQFKSIPHSMWWAWITMTTVGYGDMIPITPGGKAFASITMLVGIMSIALPLTIVSAQACADFDELTRHKAQDAVPEEPTKQVDVKLVKHDQVSELQSRLWAFFDEPNSSLAARCWSICVSLVIALSCIAIILQSMPELAHVQQHVWDNIEAFCISIFTFEFGSRLLLAPRLFPALSPSLRHRVQAVAGSKLSFVLQPFSLIDLIAILPYYVGKFGDSSNTRVFAAFRILRLIRVIRVIKLGRNSQTVTIFIDSLRRGIPALVIVIVFIASCLILFGALIYEFEKSGPHAYMYSSIPNSFWWAIVTLTTVGYGDQFPVTTGGRIVAAIAAISGYLGVTLPISIIGTTFAQLSEAAAEKRRAIEASKVPPKLRDLLHEGLLDIRSRHPGVEFDHDRITITPGTMAQPQS
eukprot:c6179_g1_i1.p1 GENE.c6179_g1_i1~~c6179_g1_i1.p1  ORF type:complete len:639 (-),score=147.78 c6179_g1_i1:242-2089(-)